MQKGESVFIKVRGYHLDVYQHVNNARYLEFIEEARWEVFDKTFRDGFLDKQNLSFVVVNVNIAFRAAAVLHDYLRIDTFLKKHGSRSVTVTQQVIKHETNELVAEADVTFVLVDNKKMKAISLTDQFLGQLGTAFPYSSSEN